MSAGKLQHELRKKQAFACHASQLRPEDWEADDLERFEESMGIEVFVRVHPTPEPALVETGFSGLD